MLIVPYNFIEIENSNKDEKTTQVKEKSNIFTIIEA